jgi:hypothetical protein
MGLESYRGIDVFRHIKQTIVEDYLTSPKIMHELSQNNLLLSLTPNQIL